MANSRWPEWGEAIVNMMVEAKPGENLLVVTETGFDRQIGESCLVAGINAKANTQLLTIPQMTTSDADRNFSSAAGAIVGANVIIMLGPAANESIARALLESRNKGGRVTQCEPLGAEDWILEGVLDVDYPRMTEVARKICLLWNETDVCHVTSQLGTDVSFRLKGRPALLADGRAVSPGDADFFPGATPSIAPVESTINGTVVIDGTLDAPLGPVSAPVTLELKEGLITSIKGGCDADALRERLHSTGDPKALAVCHWNVGISPRARMGNKMAEDEMVMGAITFGFGRQDPIFQGNVGNAKMHSDVVLTSGRVTLDGAVMCENSTLNPDLGLGGL